MADTGPKNSYSSKACAPPLITKVQHIDHNVPVLCTYNNRTAENCVSPSSAVIRQKALYLLEAPAHLPVNTRLTACRNCGPSRDSEMAARCSLGGSSSPPTPGCPFSDVASGVPCAGAPLVTVFLAEEPMASMTVSISTHEPLMSFMSRNCKKTIAFQLWTRKPCSRANPAAANARVHEHADK
jgi:hypothetical protein